LARAPGREPLEVERFETLEGEGATTASKPKQWHLFHIVAPKR